MTGRPTISGSVAFPFPRFVRLAGRPVSSYKVCLCTGVYAGILLSAAAGARSGIPPVPLGMALLLFAIAGMIGARLYHLAVNAGLYRSTGFALTARDSAEGGWSVLGGLVIVPIAFLFETIDRVPVAVFWDYGALAIAAGGAFVRFGCVCNGCCAGRESRAWFALRQHDIHGVSRRRLPVQWLEIGWWLLACGGVLWLWPRPLPPGTYAFAVLGWYGLGRVWLEPLREQSNRLCGLRIDRIVAACLAAGGAAGVAWRMSGA